MTNTNLTGAVQYNNARPYTSDLWKSIQTKTGTTADGVPGPKTATAISEFQAANNLTPDGYCGPLTLEKMDEGIFTLETRGDELFLVFPDCKLSVDADGAPNAYNPTNSGIDYLGNAGSPGNWWGIAVDESGKPFIQTPADPFPNHYVSTTAMVNGEYPANDPRRYVDSTSVEYVAMPRNLSNLLPSGWSIGKGDDVTVTRGDIVTMSIVADISGTILLEPDRLVNNVREDSKRRFGEGSIALHQTLENDPYILKSNTWRAAIGISSGVTMRTSQRV